MMTVKLAKQGLLENKADSFIFLLEEGFSFDFHLEEVESKYYSNLKQVLAKQKFEGKKNQSFSLPVEKDGEFIEFIFVGLGKLKEDSNQNLNSLRSAIKTSVSIVKKLELTSVVLDVPKYKKIGIDLEEIVKQTVIALHTSDYEFLDFKTGKDKKEELKISVLLSIEENNNLDSLEKSLSQGDEIGRAVNLARHWDDLPANVLTPTTFADSIEEMAKTNNLKCTVFGRDKALKLGMGGFAAVDSGSDQEGKFVVVEYASSKDAPTIALVGKGIVFDSGGISLKPSKSMTGMKFDMCGASAVFATMQAIAKLKPNVNVIALASIVENMPSGKACRQDDIITFMNGKTSEIISTDAEGRLILADTLCYAEEYYNPDIILDIATLTGAVVVGLGTFFTGLLSRNDDLSKQLIKSGNLTGDRLWRLPLDDVFAPAIESDVADIANCGKPTYGAGTITAGLFLEHFVKNSNWAHLDIAGTSSDVPGVKGATGVGVKLFVDYILNYK